MAVELTLAEAEMVARKTFENYAAAGEIFDSLPETTKLQSYIGTMGIVAALQELGFRISRPLKIADNLDEIDEKEGKK